MGHVTVSRSGSFSAVAEHATLTYSIMVVGRLVITRNIAFQLAQAVTIATRYSIVREQGFGQGADDRQPNESTIMSYRSQHFRLLTLIAKAYAIFFAAQQADLEYKTLRELQENQDSSGLPYTHSISAGLKAWSTSEAADGAEDARKCCGGHGFWMISGLPDIVASVTATATFEGENYVMWQQVGRYLFKCMDAARQGRALDAQLVYLTDSRGRGRDSTQFPCEAKESDFLSEEVQLDIFRHRAQRLVHFAHAAVRSSQEPPADAWNEHMMSIISASRAHIEYTVLKSFAHHLHNIPPTTTPLLRSILSHLRSLFTLSTIINPRTVDAISFVEDGYLDVLQLETIRSLVNELLDKLLPEATGLTDAWDFSHASLCSALGMWDGDAYEHIMRWVEQMPINRRAWDENEGVYQPGWKEVVDPILKAKL
jgi:acyl-CoA oxidase